jgi:hypothetical protein
LNEASFQSRMMMITWMCQYLLSSDQKTKLGYSHLLDHHQKTLRHRSTPMVTMQWIG